MATLRDPHALARASRWIPLHDLEAGAVLSCMDGRHGHGVVGAPGGHAGELVLALAAAEHLAGLTFDRDQVRALLADHLDRFGRFYVHTDRDAVERLREALVEDCQESECRLPTTPEGMTGFVAAAPPDCHPLLLDALVDAHYTGCGHLAGLLARPEVYGVRGALVQHVVRAVFERLWQGDPRVALELLEGAHEEDVVVVVRAPGRELAPETEVPVLDQEGLGMPAFTVNRPAIRYLRGRFAAWLAEALHGVAPCCTLDAEALRDAMEALGDRQLRTTVSRLAPDLPQVVLVVEPGRRDLAPFAPPAQAPPAQARPA